MVDINELKRRTEEYWQWQRDNVDKLTNREYAEQILPDEMQVAKEQGTLPDARYNHVVFLVGHSVEPILQSILAYAPDKITLIVNNRYGDVSASKQLDKVREAIIFLTNGVEILDHSLPEQDNGESPRETFKLLVDHFKETDSLIIDITGAKKSMVAGAFLFAAFADVDVSYVDFADWAYSTKWRKPYGYGCIIRPLHNPYKAFGLREWETIRSRYNDYRFEDVLAIMQSGLKKTMDDYLAESKEAVQRFMEIVECYAHWDHGRYDRAQVLAGKIKNTCPAFHLPSTVGLLGSYSVYFSDGHITGWMEDFYDDTEKFRAYIKDELNRIQRLLTIHQDFRSVVIRSASLNEVVMLARLVRIVPQEDKQKVVCFFNNNKNQTPRAGDVMQFFNRQQSDVDFIEVYGRKRSNDPKKNNEVPKWVQKIITILGHIKIANVQRQYWLNGLSMLECKNGIKAWERLLQYRNKLIHCYYAPPEELARDALRFVRTNIDDFLETRHGNKHTSPKVPENHIVEAMSWEDMCKITTLDKYLPHNLTQAE